MNFKYAINQNFFQQFIKFGLVGILNTLLTLSLIFICSYVLNFYYLISNGIGYIAGFINSFLWNKYWTFRSKGSIFKEFIKFFKVFLICYGIQFFFVFTFVQVFKIAESISQIIGMVIYTFVNFLLNKFFTFQQ